MVAQLEGLCSGSASAKQKVSAFVSAVVNFMKSEIPFECLFDS